ncbi:SAVED domain-containing protein [Escherichia fergusonii]|uniref:SAVED domain-containing protein n=1 Tax=Escherichia fergusonii TaxID=564 RepID=UPI001C467211|nr:SAVED domain-containing protein [Escherichia fergusonii]MBV7579785.1 SAVED domain-containing protein [Escherichia fergusonii]MCP9658849.1 SAVED domain-containing protein [Escherichia fergusonii]
MNEFWKHQLSKIIDYLTRQKRPGVIMMATGAALAVGPNVWNFVLTGTFRGETLSIGTAEGNVVSDYIVPIIGVILALAGLVFISIGEFQTIKQNSRKRIILVTGNGLRTTTGTGLEKVVRKVLQGIIQPQDIDITQRIRDGVVIEPEITFQRQILPAKDNITQSLSKAEPDMVQVAYGGFLPVPFTFFLGNVLDDKGDVTVFDWDRKDEEWKFISANNIDDGESFVHETICESNSDEIVLVVSCSYRVDIEQVAKSFPGQGIEHLYLENNTFNNHWSLAKQRRLSLEFAEKVKTLSSRGIRTVHLILSAQSSIVLNFGRRYDNRNMGDIIVYQFEQSNPNPYPWGIYGLSHRHENSGFIMRPQLKD